MNPAYEKLVKCYESVKERAPYKVKAALVLGSGLGDFADNIDCDEVIPYKDILGFPVSTAPGHKGQFVFGKIDGVPICCMQGRVHFYEGYDMPDVVLPIRLLKLFGADILFLTNASGGIRHDLSAGDLMLIEDQISFFVPSPLRGENIDELGTRFPDMSHIYDRELGRIIKNEAFKLKIDLKSGVYAQTKGPNYESPAEIRFLRTIGADAVGMSTACEAIAAVHSGMRVVGVSCISNLAAGISKEPLSEQEVLDAGKKVEKDFTALVKASIKSF